MATAYFPTSMTSYNNRPLVGGYKTWKATGVNSFPIGLVAKNIRPFTNKDYTNNFKTGFGLPRPLKLYRKGRAFTYPIYEPGSDTITYTNRGVNSSNLDLVKDLIDNPGTANTIQNTPATNITETLTTLCTKEGEAGIITALKPNKFFITNNPEPNVENSRLCCNQEKFAKLRVIYAKTNLNKNYYTTHSQYMQNRCQLYEQRAFNFLAPNVGINGLEKPGSPTSYKNTYYANCNCNADIQEATEYALVNKILTALLNDGLITQQQITTFYAEYEAKLTNVYKWLLTLTNSAQCIEIYTIFINNPYWGIPATGPAANQRCNKVIYKPNNFKFATQGAVDSSTRMLKLNVDTITKNAYSLQNVRFPNFYSPYQSTSTNDPFILKSKVAPCNPALMQKNGNPKICYRLFKGTKTPIDTNKYGLNYFRNGPKSAAIQT